jgi:hypothetical protein
MHPDAAALESIATSLELLVERVAGIADRHRDDPDDLLTTQLDELERGLKGSQRRLTHTIRGLDAGNG